MKTQFSYQYKSYFENKHGFFTFVPNGKIFHPYFGLETIGTFANNNLLEKKEYKVFSSFFNNTLTFKHKIKMYFPDIKTGVIFLDKINYSIDSHTDDSVSLTYSLNTDSNYKDYIEIKHHLMEFDVDVKIKSTYKTPTHPLTVKCDNIEFLLFEQKISITETTNTVKVVPYVYAHKTNEPLSAAKRTNISITTLSNNSLTYTLGLTKESSDFIKKYKGSTTSVFIEEGGLVQKEMYEFILEGFTANYSLRSVNDCQNKNILPILNDNLFEGTIEMCKKGLNSDWYFNIYKGMDLVDTMALIPCSQTQTTISADSIRNIVWKTITQNIEESDDQLSLKLEQELPLENRITIEDAYEICLSYKKDFMINKIKDSFEVSEIFN